MSKSILKNLAFFLAFCFLFSVPAVVAAFNGDHPASTLKVTQTSLEANSPVIDAPPTLRVADENQQCMDKCMQTLMKCLLGGTTEADKCEEALNQCITECEQSPENNLSLSQLIEDNSSL